MVSLSQKNAYQLGISKLLTMLLAILPAYRNIGVFYHQKNLTCICVLHGPVRLNQCH